MILFDTEVQECVQLGEYLDMGDRCLIYLVNRVEYRVFKQDLNGQYRQADRTEGRRIIDEWERGTVLKDAPQVASVVTVLGELEETLRKLLRDSRSARDRDHVGSTHYMYWGGQYDACLNILDLLTELRTRKS